MRSPHGAGKRDAKGGEGEEEDDDDVFEMMVREPESDESDEDDDLREREAVLQEELAVATKRMEELKKTLVQTKSFIQQQAPQAKSSGSSSAKSSGSGSGRSRTPEAGPEMSLEVTESDSEDELGGEEESGDYKDERFEEDDEAVAPRKPPTSPSRAVVGASGSKKGLEPLRAPAGVPVAESKSARGSSSSSSSTPRTGKLEDRARDSRALLVRMLGEETFNQAWAALRELHSNVDPKEPLARQEAREKAVMAPILKDKARCLELLKQLLFMTQSLEP
jgi:flagellar motility protein MotE (MotC chaperone)